MTVYGGNFYGQSFCQLSLDFHVITIERKIVKFPCIEFIIRQGKFKQMCCSGSSCAINKLRDLKPHLPLEDYTATSIDEPQPDFEKQETNHMLWNMVAQLGELDNEIFLRYYLYGEKTRDIAKYMGINTSTVKTRLCRGRQRLKIIIEKGGNNDE